jgi:hypothetical protein
MSVPIGLDARNRAHKLVDRLIFRQSSPFALGAGLFSVTGVSAEARIGLQPRRYGKAEAVVGKPAVATDTKGFRRPLVLTMRERFVIAAPKMQLPKSSSTILKKSLKNRPRAVFSAQSGETGLARIRSV